MRAGNATEKKLHFFIAILPKPDIVLRYELQRVIFRAFEGAEADSKKAGRISAGIAGLIAPAWQQVRESELCLP